MRRQETIRRKEGNKTIRCTFWGPKNGRIKGYEKNVKYYEAGWRASRDGTSVSSHWRGGWTRGRVCGRGAGQIPSVQRAEGVATCLGREMAYLQKAVVVTKRPC